MGSTRIGPETGFSYTPNLKAMVRHCRDYGVTSLAMPRIGCGLDRLRWHEVRAVLKEVFRGSDVAVTVYSLEDQPREHQEGANGPMSRREGTKQEHKRNRVETESHRQGHEYKRNKVEREGGTQVHGQDNRTYKRPDGDASRDN